MLLRQQQSPPPFQRATVQPIGQLPPDPAGALAPVPALQNEDPNAAEVALLAYLQSRSSGLTSQSAATTCMARARKFLQWLRVERKLNGSLLELIHCVLTQKYASFIAYKDYLEAVDLFAPTTVVHHMLALRRVLRWYTRAREPSEGHPSVREVDSPNAFGILADLITDAKRANRHRQSKRSTHEEQLRLRRIPEFGLADLHRAVVEDWERPVVPTQPADLSKGVYDAHLGHMYSGMYTTSVQGRVGGFGSLQLKDASTMLTESCALSSTFKTSSKFGYQPVMASKLTKEMLEAFLVMRELVVRRTGSRETALFINFDGAADAPSIGRRVTAFFKTRLNLHITTTAIRSLVETAADQLRRQQKLTREQQEAIHAINGHSGATARDYYIRTAREDDARMGHRSFAVMLSASQKAAAASGRTTAATAAPGHVSVPLGRVESADVGCAGGWGEKVHDHHDVVDDCDDDHVDDDHPLDDADVNDDRATGCAGAPLVFSREETANGGTRHCKSKAYSVSCFGAHHPTPDWYKKAVWTEAEIAYIGHWYEAERLANPRNTNNMAARCLRRVHDDPNAAPIFHQNHVLDSGRFRQGIDKYLQLAAQSPS